MINDKTRHILDKTRLTYSTVFEESVDVFNQMKTYAVPGAEQTIGPLEEHKITALGLIQNALAHSHATAITVSVSMEDHRIVISVMDNGIGISSEDLPYIFQRLYKCDKDR